MLCAHCQLDIMKYVQSNTPYSVCNIPNRGKLLTIYNSCHLHRTDIICTCIVDEAFYSTPQWWDFFCPWQRRNQRTEWNMQWAISNRILSSGIDPAPKELHGLRNQSPCPDASTRMLTIGTLTLSRRDCLNQYYYGDHRRPWSTYLTDLEYALACTCT